MNSSTISPLYSRRSDLLPQAVRARVERALPQGGTRRRLRDIRVGGLLSLATTSGRGLLTLERRLTIGEPSWKPLDRKR